eukprot:CAMPEP_0118800452 /NCGR_PEP_ID=MMETSP1161-20130426/2345_1 /TAXON_ID=249345 /ORGANISM="Picochlorum oklahomensis, Strain CCMP2329" /LENGTH=434 /DNA_ID=CAMNT_0006728279 /DNA_START=129 /DNA_END=1433 /DNA_ORIENTATION=-
MGNLSGSKRSASTATAGNPANISLERVRPLWLCADSPKSDKFLVLEDTDTGDVLMPLIYMKSILVANYSRKLASLKHREVRVPQSNALANKQGLLFWHWAFESPHSIKVLIRRELGEGTPQGHLRLVLLPIVYNAMSCKEELRAHPLFPPLYRAMRHSSYWPLLLDPGKDILRKLDATILHGDGSNKVFDGPKLVESTAMKYMFMFRSLEEMEISKRLRTTTNLTESQVTNSASIQQEGGLESADAQEDEREKGRPGSSLVSQLLSQQADTEVKANTPKERAYSVTLSTDQLRDIVESRHRQLMKEVTSLKGSVLVMMQCLVSILSDTGEKHTPTSLHHPLHSAPAAPRYDPSIYQRIPPWEPPLYDQPNFSQPRHFGYTQHQSPGEATLQQILQALGANQRAKVPQNPIMPQKVQRPQDDGGRRGGSRSRKKK